MDRDHRLGRLGKRRHAPCPGSVSLRVPAGAGKFAVGQRQLPRFRQRHELVAAEAERAGCAADHEPLHPTLRSGGFDVQVESVAVAVPPGLGDRAAEGSREAWWGCGPLRLVRGGFGGSGAIPYSIPNSELDCSESPWTTSDHTPPEPLFTVGSTPDLPGRSGIAQENERRTPHRTPRPSCCEARYAPAPTAVVAASRLREL